MEAAFAERFELVLTTIIENLFKFTSSKGEIPQIKVKQKAKMDAIATMLCILYQCVR